eukprot:104692-Rhodomonas_salina.1
MRKEGRVRPRPAPPARGGASRKGSAIPAKVDTAHSSSPDHSASPVHGRGGEAVCKRGEDSGAPGIQ